MLGDHCHTASLLTGLLILHANMATHVSDLHRVYLQAVLSRRVMREETGLTLYKRTIRAIQGTSHSIIHYRITALTGAEYDADHICSL